MIVEIESTQSALLPSPHLFFLLLLHISELLFSFWVVKANVKKLALQVGINN
jgi:hypothetical protein